MNREGLHPIIRAAAAMLGEDTVVIIDSQHTALGDVGAADHDDAASQTASLEFNADLGEVDFDLVPTERASRTGQEPLRCRAEARSHTLYRATAGGVSAMV